MKILFLVLIVFAVVVLAVNGNNEDVENDFDEYFDMNAIPELHRLKYIYWISFII